MTLPSNLAKSVQHTQEWLHALMPEIGVETEDQAWQALRGVLHHLRDRMAPEEATHFAAQLPTVVRGVYYEGWSPAKTPEKERVGDEFLVRVAEEIGPNNRIDPERAARAVFALLDRELDAGQIDEVIHMLPDPAKKLWPEEAQTRAAARKDH